MASLNSVDTPAAADVSKSLPYLAMGEASFAALRTMNGVYVDKTDLIFSLARSKRFVFLSRPRRFGKSLLSSAFASLFRSGTEAFHGLKIEKLWNDTGRYRVLELDFSLLNSDSSDAFSLSLRDAISERLPEAQLHECDDPFGWIAKFGFWLESQPVLSMVVLIDEYDAPLVDCLENPTLFSAIQKKMSEFFRTLKSRSGCLRFFFMTGISKFTNTGIFSTFNLLWDISHDPQYGTLLGFTEDEIRRHFSSHLYNAAQQLGMTVDELMDHLRLNYDGYCFDEQNSTHVFSNWSVLNFFNSPKREFKNYWWMSAGQPAVLMKYLKRNAVVGIEKYDALIPVAKPRLESAQTYAEMDFDILLFHLGYLTIKGIDSYDNLLFGYPNEEVRSSLAQLYADAIFSRSLAELTNPRPLLAEGKVADFVRYLNSVFNLFDYVRFPVHDESSCRSHVQVLLVGAKILSSIEVRSAKGRSDLEIRVADKRWIFEFKYAATEKDCEEQLRNAVAQIVAKRYGQGPDASVRIRLAIVFNAVQRQFSHWEIVP